MDIEINFDALNMRLSELKLEDDDIKMIIETPSLKTAYDVLYGTLGDIFKRLFPQPTKQVIFHWDRFLNCLGKISNINLITNDIKDKAIKIFGNDFFVSNIRNVFNSEFFGGFMGRDIMICDDRFQGLIYNNLYKYPNGCVIFSIYPKEKGEWFWYLFESPVYLSEHRYWVRFEYLKFLPHQRPFERVSFPLTIRKCYLKGEKISLVEGNGSTIDVDYLCRPNGFWKQRKAFEEINELPQYSHI